MKKKILIFNLLVHFVLLIFPLRFLIAENPNIYSSGSWILSIDPSHLQSGAGSNLQSTYDSPLDATQIDIHANQNTSWVVYGRRLPSIHKNLTIYVRRTSDGKGKGLIEGGENFIPLGEGDTALFRGIGPRRDITVQSRINGVSINISPGARDLQILYTLEGKNL